MLCLIYHDNASIILLIWWLDRHEPNHFGLSLAFWGASIATGISILGNTMAYSILVSSLAKRYKLIVSIMAPVVEEFTKVWLFSSCICYFMTGR